MGSKKSGADLKNQVSYASQEQEFELGGRIPKDQSLKGKSSYFDKLFHQISKGPISLLQQTIFGCVSAFGLASLVGPSTMHFFSDTMAHLQHHLPTAMPLTAQTMAPNDAIVLPSNLQAHSTNNFLDAIRNTAFFALLPVYAYFCRKIRGDDNPQGPRLAYAMAANQITNELPTGMKPKQEMRRNMFMMNLLQGFGGGGKDTDSAKSDKVEVDVNYMDAKFIKDLEQGNVTLNEEILSSGAVDQIKIEGDAPVADIKDKYEYDGSVFTAI